ncbi:RNA polymerase sigma factor [Stratiformator vulcanicus]|uniref:RNA polymerase sigma factor n=1 Tax=Stratiformator vulcanicus TaxID=2527980 RepID=UPI002877D931|nr:sigma-70 family RNA polymerase sigma factor [Stratiformator vulcanicus]
MHVVEHNSHLRSQAVRADQLDDICAEVFLEILRDDYAVLRRFRRQSSLASYLAVIARRVAIREMSNRRKAEELGHVKSSKATSGRRPEPPESRIADRDEVENLLSGLSGEEAEIIRRYHLGGQSYREISRELGVPENSIGPLLSRARDQLRRKRGVVGT